MLAGKTNAQYGDEDWTAGAWQDTGMSALLGPAGENRHSAVIALSPEHRRGRIRVRIEERTLFRTRDDEPTCTLGPMHYFDAIPIQQIDPSLYVGGKT